MWFIIQWKRADNGLNKKFIILHVHLYDITFLQVTCFMFPRREVIYTSSVHTEWPEVKHAYWEFWEAMAICNHILCGNQTLLDSCLVLLGRQETGTNFMETFATIDK